MITQNIHKTYNDNSMYNITHLNINTTLFLSTTNDPLDFHYYFFFFLVSFLSLTVCFLSSKFPIYLLFIGVLLNHTLSIGLG